MYDFKFADIGEGIHEGQILKWHFKVGDKVEEGETLCVVETDKVNAELPAPVTGIIKKIGAQVGDTIHVGETLVLIDEDASETDKEAEETTDEAPKEEKQKETKKEPIAEGKEEDNAGVVGALDVSDDIIETSNEHEDTAEAPSKKRALATPVARKMAKDLGVDINNIQGNGPNGRVMKEDIKAYAEQGKTQSATQAKTYGMPKMPEENTRREKVSKLRKTIVKAMDTSHALIPATTVMDEFDVTELVTLRNKHKARQDEDAIKLTYLPLIIKAVILTMKKYPVFNASFDHETDEIIYKDYFNIGIAVDTDKGLIVPNIKDADQLSVLELAKAINDLAEAARNGKITLTDLQNTTFSITNYGAFGSKLGTPVINHPEVAILGMGAITKKPVVIHDEIVIRDMFPVSLTIDHRIIDGGDAGRFMVYLRDLLSDPMTLLLS